MPNLILQLHTDGAKECTAWDNVPVEQGTQIAVYTPTGAPPVATQCAERCFDLLKQEITLVGRQSFPAPCGYMQGRNALHSFDCHAGGVGVVRRVLIYVADGSASVDPQVAAYFPAGGAIIIPVVDASLGPAPSLLLPMEYRSILATPLEHFDPLPVISRITTAAGILTDRLRIFISYKHQDAAKMAGQLFHRLSEEMFDVFLDRFSSRTGDDFVALIKEDLFDKSCLLVLETSNIHQSSYCKYEVATALSYNLGLMAVDLPGSQRIFPAIHKRRDLRYSGLTPSGELTARDLDDVVAFVRHNYTEEMSWRLWAQDTLLFDSIRAAKLFPHAEGIGRYRVNNGHHDYTLGMVRRPPGIADFMDAERRASRGAGNRPFVFGPVSAVRTPRATQIDWMERKSGINAVDEGHVQRALDDIAKNRR